MKPRLLLGGILFALVALAGPAFADDLPNPALTPGAVSETHAAAICAPGYARAHRVWHDKAGTLARYGLPLSVAGQYEDDDLVPVCLGGDNADPKNHWPEAWPEAERKDALEWRVCSEICLSRGPGEGGDAELARLQAAFAKDWTALYREMLPNAALVTGH